MEARQYISRVLLAVSLAVAFLVGGSLSVFAQTYGTYENPFAKNSIWNLPIASGAKYADTGLSTKEQNLFFLDHVGVHKVNTKDPLRKVYKRAVSHFNDYCGGVDTSKMFYQVNLPNNFLVTKKLGNGYHAFVFPDGSIKGGGLGWERCANGGNAGQMHADESNVPGYTISGNGLLDKGGSGASKLSLIGGVIRKGELTSAPGVPIPHALKPLLMHSTLYCNKSDSTPGYRWPAKAADGGACTAGHPQQYTGTNPNLKIGSLLAIAPGYNCNALNTEPGRKICRALQTYGGYVSDSCCQNPKAVENFWMLTFEVESPDDKPVEQELASVYGIKMSEVNKRTANQATKEFKSDLDTIYNNLQVVTNTSAEYAKGPGGSTTITKLATPMGLKLVD